MINSKSLKWISGLTITILMACKNSHQTPAIDVVGHIKGDLRILDSIPYGLIKITEKNGGQPDSVYIKKAELWNMVSPFLSEEINQENLSDRYTESSFADATIQSVMITYQAKEKDQPINQVAVYVNPENGRISRIYITGFFDDATWKGKKQLLWAEQKGFTIISTGENDASGTETITEKIIRQ
jgi:hypothetical protein